MFANPYLLEGINTRAITTSASQDQFPQNPRAADLYEATQNMPEMWPPLVGPINVIFQDQVKFKAGPQATLLAQRIHEFLSLDPNRYHNFARKAMQFFNRIFEPVSEEHKAAWRTIVWQLNVETPPYDSVECTSEDGNHVLYIDPFFRNVNWPDDSEDDSDDSDEIDWEYHQCVAEGTLPQWHQNFDLIRNAPRTRLWMNVGYRSTFRMQRIAITSLDGL